MSQARGLRNSLTDHSAAVHQTDLDLEEKILRHFDLSSQYGVRDLATPGFFSCVSVNVIYSRASASPGSSGGDVPTCSS